MRGLKAVSRNVTLVAASALITAAIVLVTTDSGATSSASGCSTSQSPSTAAAAEACGFEVSSAPVESSLSGGGESYAYKNSGGELVRELIPPENFDPLTATTAQLTEYGFPPKPSDTSSAAYQKWSEIVTGNVYLPAPTFLYSPPASACTAETGYTNYQCSSTSGYYSSNWSGIVDGYEVSGYPFSTTYFNDAAIEYTEPTPPSSNTCNTYSALFWVGMGGFGNSNLSQDGTAMGMCGVTNGSFWYEMLPDQQYVQVVGSGYVASPGDTMWAQVIYVNSTTMQVYMKDVTSGLTLSQDVTVSTSVYDGATAEGIAERPTYYPGGVPTFYDLENYGTWNVDWDYSFGGSPNFEGPSGLWNFYNLPMLNGSDDLSSVTTPPVQSISGNGSFVTTFHESS